jgi:1-acyl-sn-glycerol-3-phosphate acyltransferase
MNEELRDRAPSADDIENRFSSAVVTASRPAVLGALGVLKFVQRFNWSAHFEYKLERLQMPMVFAANHRSHCDTAAILGTLPKKMRSCTAVAAALDVFGPDTNNGIRRRVSKDLLQLVVGAGFHAFAFDRMGPPLRSVRTSVQLIRNGWNLLLYPEGTRSRDGELAPFKPGVGLLARFTERPVIPVHVEGGDVVLPYGAFLPGPGHLSVRYGSPIWYQPGDTPITFAARIEEEVRQLSFRQRDRSMAPSMADGVPIEADARKQPA